MPAAAWGWRGAGGGPDASLCPGPALSLWQARSLLSCGGSGRLDLLCLM